MRDETLTSINDENMHVSDKVQFALGYNDAIEEVNRETFNSEKHTYIQVLEHTPQIYIDKAEANDRKILIAWDVAHLAMKKNGSIQGHYHGLGEDVMKALPSALKNPLYIIKQKNGRIAAITQFVKKAKRIVFASVELEAYKDVVFDGEKENGIYNLIVTVSDAQHNYLQNTIFSGDVVYNKNDEDPAHFILRLKSLKKAMPKNDLAESSIISIPDSSEKVNTTDEKIQFSRETEDVNPKKDTKVTMTRGTAQKQKAKYKSDKVYSQNGVR